MHGIKPPRQISGGRRLRTHIIWLLARPCALLLVARLGRAEVKTTRRLPARPAVMTLDRENEAGAKNLNMMIVEITGCSGLQVLFGEFAKLIGNGPRRSQHD